MHSWTELEFSGYEIDVNCFVLLPVIEFLFNKKFKSCELIKTL